MDIPIKGNIVEDYHIKDEYGDTHIIISDAAYIHNTPEDNKRILAQASQASLNIILHRLSKKSSIC